MGRMCVCVCAFAHWQGDRLDQTRRQEYNLLAKKVKRAVRRDKKRWWDDLMTDMKEDIKRHRQGNFFKRMKQLTKTTCTTILDENNQPTGTLGESLARRRRHFDKVLNVRRKVRVDSARHPTDSSDVLCVERKYRGMRSQQPCRSLTCKRQ